MPLCMLFTFYSSFSFFTLNVILSPFSTDRAGLHIHTATIPTFANSEKRHIHILTLSVRPDFFPNSPFPPPNFHLITPLLGYKPEEDTEVRPIQFSPSSSMPSPLTAFPRHSGRLIPSDKPQQRLLSRAPISPLPSRMSLPLTLNLPGVPAVATSSSDGEMEQYATRPEESERLKFRCFNLPLNQGIGAD